MARLGGAAGAAPDVRHQPPGKQFTYTTISHLIASTLVAQRSRQLASMHEVIGSSPAIILFLFCGKTVYTRLNLYIPCMNIFGSVYTRYRHVETCK